MASGRPVDVMTRTAGQQLPGSVHIDTELTENRRTVGPDGHRTTARRHVWALVEDRDLVSVAQQSACDRNAAYSRADDQDPKFQTSMDSPP